jgi:hypothetical protein
VGARRTGGGERRQAGPLRPWAEKGGGRPVNQRKQFFSLNLSLNSPKSPILSTKNSFSKGDPKIKVVPNFILYNIALGFMLKFQLDFEIEI